MSDSPENRARKLFRGVTVRNDRINLWQPVDLSDMVSELRRRSSEIIIEPDIEVFTLPPFDGFRVTDVFSNGQVRGFSADFEALVDDADYVLYRGRILKPINYGERILRQDTSFDLVKTFGVEKTLAQFQSEVSPVEIIKNPKITNIVDERNRRQIG